ncbi:MAG: FAD-binding protein, partial [Candidatus Kapaibacteriota bacterium]
LILTAEIFLKRIRNEFLYLQTIKFNSLSEFFEINEESEKKYEYTVAWIDATNGGINSIRGIYQRANHLDYDHVGKIEKFKIKVPIILPFSLINKFTTFFFNVLYYTKQFDKLSEEIVHYDKFFYPLDGVDNWNYLYGRKGFLQYQFVIPKENSEKNLLTILNTIKRAGLSSFLTVLKTFGKMPKAGLLSFPRDGLTLAFDFPISSHIFSKLDEIDKLIVEFGGALYPAKDARMKPEIFRRCFPEVDKFILHKDFRFSSAFWERVMC